MSPWWGRVLGVTHAALTIFDYLYLNSFFEAKLAGRLELGHPDIDALFVALIHTVFDHKLLFAEKLGESELGTERKLV